MRRILNETEKRWLEVMFYLLCRKIFSINHNIEDVKNFIKGFCWTNMFDYDTLINVLTTQQILDNSYFIPTKQELILLINDPNCKLNVDRSSLRELIKFSEYQINRHITFHTLMRNEINPLQIFPKLTLPNIHTEIYSFLLAIQYTTKLVKKLHL